MDEMFGDHFSLLSKKLSRALGRLRSELSEGSPVGGSRAKAELRDLT